MDFAFAHSVLCHGARAWHTVSRLESPFNTCPVLASALQGLARFTQADHPVPVLVRPSVGWLLSMMSGRVLRAAGFDCATP